MMFSNSFLPTQCVSSSMWRHWYYQITVITRTAKNISHHRFHSCCFTRCNQHFRHFTEIDILKVFLSSGNICHQHSHNHYHLYYEPHPQLWLWIIKVCNHSLTWADGHLALCGYWPPMGRQIWNCTTFVNVYWKCWNCRRKCTIFVSVVDAVGINECTYYVGTHNTRLFQEVCSKMHKEACMQYLWWTLQEFGRTRICLIHPKPMILFCMSPMNPLNP